VSDRDRDAAGRPRSGRPRDALGRPLPRGASGVERLPDDLALPPGPALAESQRLLDVGQPFAAHEVLEGTWKSAPAHERDLWQGLAQLAVGLTHLLRGNPSGAAALVVRGRDRIRPYAGAAPYGIDVVGLLTWAEEVLAQLPGLDPASVPVPRLRRPDVEAPMPAALLAHALRRDPSGPLITYYDDATGERTELSATTLANWVAKTANLLVDDLDIEPGSRVAVLLPAHWQHAVVLLACWRVGACITRNPAEADLLVSTPDVSSTALPGDPVIDDSSTDDETADVAAAADLAAARALQPPLLALSLLPMNRPCPGLPPGAVDYAAEVLAHGDSYTGPVPDPEAVALDARHGTFTYAALATHAAARAGELGLQAGDRLLAVDRQPFLPVTDWLLAPLAAGASIVLCRNPEHRALAHRAEIEQVTATLGADVEGVRRADRDTAAHSCGPTGTPRPADAGRHVGASR